MLSVAAGCDVMWCVVLQCPESTQLTLSGPVGREARSRDDDSSSESQCEWSETALVRLHRRVIVSVEQFNSAQCQWNKLIENAASLEDVRRNQASASHVFVPSLQVVPRTTIWTCCRCPRFG